MTTSGVASGLRAWLPNNTKIWPSTEPSLQPRQSDLEGSDNQWINPLMNGWIHHVMALLGSGKIRRWGYLEKVGGQTMALKAMVYVRPHPVLALSPQRPCCERPHLSFHASSVMMLSFPQDRDMESSDDEPNLRNSEPEPASFHPARTLVTEMKDCLTHASTALQKDLNHLFPGKE